MYHAFCSLLSRPTNAQHTYVVTFYISSVLVHVLMHPHHLQTVLSFYFAKVIKVIKVTNSISSQLQCLCDPYVDVSCMPAYILITVFFIPIWFAPVS